MNTIIPTPKLISPREGTLNLSGDKAAGVQVCSLCGAYAGEWLVARLREELGLAIRRTQGEPGAAVHLGLIEDLAMGGLADRSWRTSPAFAGAVGREQGYIVDVTPRFAVVGALTEHGLQHGAATLMQLFRREGGTSLAPCCRIEDWPDFRFRVGADWLLNAEINRWGYERGDGREALLARMKRKLEMAARYKINGVWFDGFGWGTERFAGYAEFCRELASHARARHIRLAHAGYGGGYGFAYQKHFIYESPYQGQLFENRTRYPAGEVYDCVGHPSYPTSWRYGTCLSNQALAGLKIAEFVEFARQCQPGILYIHDVDTGDFERAREGWRRRCARCRERWPDDEMVSERGGAAAYANWFRQLAAAINSIQSADGGYVAVRDCEIVFVGPVYTGCHEPDATWVKECEYFSMVSRLMGRLPNVQFGIREQFVCDAPQGPRVAMLAERLKAVGNGHGVFVIPFVGGDNYFSDQLVSTGPALHRYYLGADSVYTKTMGAVAEPVQLLCAEYGWNAAAPGSYAPAASRADALELLKRCTRGVETTPEIFDDSGAHGRAPLLRRACDQLYGSQAGRCLAELFSLGVGEGAFPLATGWGTASREVAKLLATPDRDSPTRPAYWQRREEMTAKALALATRDLDDRLPNEDVRGDVQWLRTCLEVGKLLCRVLRACWEWKLGPNDSTRALAGDALSDLENYLAAHVSTPTTDPVGGDIAVWRAIAAKLKGMMG